MNAVLPSVHVKSVTWDQMSVQKVLKESVSANSVDNLVIGFVPKAHIGVLVARINLALKSGGRVFIRPEHQFLKPILEHYGLKRDVYENREGMLAFRKGI